MDKEPQIANTKSAAVKKKKSTYLSWFQFVLQIVLADAFIADSQPPRYFLLVLHESTHMPHHHSLELTLLVRRLNKKRKKKESDSLPKLLPH